MLIKLSTGDVGLGQPTDFAVYSNDGKLLLQKGHVIDSEGLLQQLYRLGYRKDTEAGGGGAAHAHAHAYPGGADPNALLFGTAHLDPVQPDKTPAAPKKTATLPNLQEKVEFFHLTRAGSADALRMELAGVIPDAALIARHARPDAPMLAAGTVYEARLFTGSRVFKFSTALLPDSAGPLGCYFLRYPESVSHAVVRKHHRVSTSIAGKLRTNEYQRPIVDVVVEDMSSVGVGISTGEDCLSVGQNAHLAMNLPIDNRHRLVSVVVEVRNRRQEGDLFKYGLEIVQLSDEVRRDIKDFVLESVAAD
ncbi:PilZ domain-containing protein [Burkholderia sp. WAC0059]|uniref:PilZ domain-containing protein n=1 Tax=Burkholderia sp. WAC0059 TaxID=2066022 RepID=UPI0015E05FAD|nr:PilZ domain-containing protein [Burkholderia sp. WAC0059]